MSGRLDAGVELSVCAPEGVSRLNRLAERGGYRARAGIAREGCNVQLINPCGGLGKDRAHGAALQVLP